MFQYLSLFIIAISSLCFFTCIHADIKHGQPNLLSVFVGVKAGARRLNMIISICALILGGCNSYSCVVKKGAYDYITNDVAVEIINAV